MQRDDRFGCGLKRHVLFEDALRWKLTVWILVDDGKECCNPACLVGRMEFRGSVKLGTGVLLQALGNLGWEWNIFQTLYLDLSSLYISRRPALARKKPGSDCNAATWRGMPSRVHQTY